MIGPSAMVEKHGEGQHARCTSFGPRCKDAAGRCRWCLQQPSPSYRRSSGWILCSIAPPLPAKAATAEGGEGCRFVEPAPSLWQGDRGEDQLLRECGRPAASPKAGRRPESIAEPPTLLGLAGAFKTTGCMLSQM